jgi:RecA/RadA recombinase
MKTDQFLEHHGIAGNPFSEEDAQTDTVFKRRCLVKIHHPAWDKFFGSPADPSTALVFGEKGSGKTALRLQAVAELDAYNQAHPGERVFVISYDDFNPYLDHFKAAVRARDTNQALAKFRLQDHMDAILAQGVTQLVDALTSEKVDLSALSVDQRRDLLMLAALYDQSTGEPIERRWSRLRRRSGFRPLWTRRDLQIGFGTTLAVVALIALFPALQRAYVLPWLLLPVLAGWLYWGWRLARAEWFAREIRKALRVLSRDPSALRWELLWFKPSELGGQPLPSLSKTGGEERYELLRKFQGVLQSLGYAGIVVLIDRVDEPQQIEGDPRKMRALIWPLLDHKFLRHPGIGIKLLLPIELAYYLEKEDKEFYDRARPDKLNMIKPLRWTGPSLYDLAGDRLRACATTPSSNGDGPRLRQLVDETVGDDSLKDALGNLRTPRQLFKFLHRLIEEHCHRHTEDNPKWSVDGDTFRTTFTAYMRDLDAFDRGYGHG